LPKMKMARWAHVPHSTIDRTSEGHTGNDVNDPERTCRFIHFHRRNDNLHRRQLFAPVSFHNANYGA
jgi:hypothetical protein